MSHSVLQLRDALELKGRPAPRDTRQTDIKVLCKGPCLGEEPTDARLFESLESFPLKPAPLRLHAPFLRSNLRLRLDHPFAMVLSTGTAHTLGGCGES